MALVGSLEIHLLYQTLIVPLFTDISRSVARYGCVNDAAYPTCTDQGFTLAWKHPGYFSSGGGTADFRIGNDIALLKLNQGYYANEFPASVGTVCLPSQRFPAGNGEDITVLGWGGINSNTDQSPVLKEV